MENLAPDWQSSNGKLKKAEGEKRESAGAGRLWRDKSGNGDFCRQKTQKGTLRAGKFLTEANEGKQAAG
jgi:hypothetical protein